MSKSPHRAAPWSRPLADLVGAVIDPVLARQGFGQSDVVLFWEEIVGERLAAMSEPLCLRWPPRGKTQREHVPGILVVRVEGGFALELQHVSDLVIERVNAHLGFAAIDRIAIRQGPLARQRIAKASRAPPSADAMAAADLTVAGVHEEALRAALVRLGARVNEATQSRKPSA